MQQICLRSKACWSESCWGQCDGANPSDIKAAHLSLTWLICPGKTLTWVTQNNLLLSYLLIWNMSSPLLPCLCSLVICSNKDRAGGLLIYQSINTLPRAGGICSYSLYESAKWCVVQTQIEAWISQRLWPVFQHSVIIASPWVFLWRVNMLTYTYFLIYFQTVYFNVI